MIVNDDWLMRQIYQTINVICKVFFSKDADTSMEQFDIDKDELTGEGFIQLGTDLLALIKEQKISDAEDLLYETIDPENRLYLKLALDFYAKINDLSDEELIAADFPRSEIENGVNDLMDLFELRLPVDLDYSM